MIRRHFANLKRSRQRERLSEPSVKTTEILATEELNAPAGPKTSGIDPVTELREGQEVRGHHRYRLSEQLGKGAFGAVWAATCVEIDQDAADIPPKQVALKFFSVVDDDEGQAFLRRELSALRSMRSRAIPRIYDWTIDDRLSFFVMDCYKYGTLISEFKTPGRFDDKKTWRLLVDLLRALQVAHRSGMLHLDIKPSNVVRDGAGGYKLIDFGISQACQVIEGPARTVGAGTRGYQAPEQRRLELRKLDTRTDLWAVGATAWALRSGCALSRHESKFNKEATGDQPSLVPLSSVCPDIAPELEEIIMDLVREDQDARPGGAAAVLERIKEATRIAVPEEPAGAEPRPHTDEEVDVLVNNLMDPLWSSLCRRHEFRRHFAKFEKDDYLCREGSASYDAFVLLSGKVRIERESKILDTDDREGIFIGEISTLSGTSRAASVRADGTVWTCMFNAAEFERLLAAHPSMGNRLLKLMADRLVHATRAAAAR